MENELLLKVFHNKKNNQLSIALPKKNLLLGKRRIPKKVKLNIKELLFE